MHKELQTDTVAQLQVVATTRNINPKRYVTGMKIATVAVTKEP